MEDIVAHGERVYTLALRPERAAPRFRAGQFLHLALDPYDPTGFWPESRVFSIASPPAQRHSLRITYAVHGTFTDRMERELVEGREVWIKMPYGDFIVEGTNVVLFAGGTGITAFTAFLEDVSADESSAVTLAYGARTPDLLIYRDLVERCTRRSPSLDVLYYVEDAGDPVAPPFIPGKVSVGAVWERLPQPFEAAYYISGPPPMLRSLSNDLRARHVREEAIHIDAWE